VAENWFIAFQRHFSNDGRELSERWLTVQWGHFDIEQVRKPAGRIPNSRAPRDEADESPSKSHADRLCWFGTRAANHQHRHIRTLGHRLHPVRPIIAVGLTPKILVERTVFEKVGNETTISTDRFEFHRFLEIANQTSQGNTVYVRNDCKDGWAVSLNLSDRERDRADRCHCPKPSA